VIRLRKRGLLAPTGLALTDDGRGHVDEQWLLNDDRMPDEAPLRVHVGPMGAVGTPYCAHRGSVAIWSRW
jgi:hypothetical protein